MSEQTSVIFIHGLGNKPEPGQLRRLWRQALAQQVDGDPGFDLEAVGVAPSFVYWADLFHDAPLAATEYESAANRNVQLEQMVGDPTMPSENQDWLRALAAHYPEVFEDAPVAEAEAQAVTEEELQYEWIPLPEPVKKRLMRRFLREAHDYLYDCDGIRGTIRDRVMEALTAVPDDARRVLVGHSQGSFIAYDVMTAVAGCPRIDGFLTLGSPLGLDEIQDRLTWSRHNGFPRRLAGPWVNVYDAWDVVSRPDPKLAGDFRRDGEEVVVDVNENNWGRWRHSATKYFKGPLLRRHLRRLCAREEP